MNNNITLLAHLLVINKKSKLIIFDNYNWKLIYILNFNNINIKSKLFSDKYKLLNGFKNIINKFRLECNIFVI
jgi:hypothetical protein